MKNTFFNFVNRSLLGLTHAMAKIPDFSVRHPKKLIASLVLLTLFFMAGIPRIKLDMSMEAFFRTDDPALHYYDVFHFLFGSDQFLILMYQPPNKDVFSKQSLQLVKNLEDALNNERIKPDSILSRITRVRSIYSADYLHANQDSLINRKFIGPDRMPVSKEDSELLRQLALKDKDFPGSLFSKDSSLGILLVQTDFGSRLQQSEEQKQEDTQNDAVSLDESSDFDFDQTEDTPSGLSLDPKSLPDYEKPGMPEFSEFMTAFRKVLKQQHWHKGLQAEANAMGYLAVGNPWMMDFFNRIVLKEMSLFSVVSMVLIIIVLWLIVGSLPGMVWPALIVGIGIIWTLGIIGWSGIAVNMLINIIVFLILTVGVAASIHILSGYKQFREKGLEHHIAMTKTLQKTGLPIFLAALTTIAGMLSMLIVPIAPIQAFAFFAAISVVVTFILTLFYLPLGMHYWAPKINMNQGQIKVRPIDRILQDFLKEIYHIAHSYPKTIIIIFTAATIVVAAGIPQVRIDTNISTTIKKGAGLQEALHAIDDNFGGTSTAEILIDSGVADGIKDPELLKAMDTLKQKILQGRPDIVNQVDSVVKLAKRSYQNMTDGSEKNYIIPDDKDTLSQTLFSFESADASTRKLFVDDEWQVARMTIKAQTHGSHEYEAFISQMQNWLDESFADYKKEHPEFKATITGSIPLMMTMMAFISKAQLNSYILVIAVIAVLLLLIFGSFKFGLMALIPNIFPIMVIMGITGWMDIPLDMDTLLVMPLAIGIAVDDSIHFLTHYRTELLRGKHSRDAIKSSLEQVGQAMIYTSVVLSLGFLVFTFSVHQGLTNFGILASIAMFTALLADILLLPAMIDVFNPFKHEKLPKEQTESL